MLTSVAEVCLCYDFCRSTCSTWMLGIVGTRFLLVLADLVVLCITWSATYRHRQKSGHPRISDILFRDGMYDAPRVLLAYSRLMLF